MKIHSNSYELVEIDNLGSFYRGLKLFNDGLKDLNSISKDEPIYIGSCEGKFLVTYADVASEKNINFPEYSNFLEDIQELHSTWTDDRRGFQCWPSGKTIEGYVLDIGDSSTGITAEFTLTEDGIMTVKNDSYLKPYENDKKGMSTIKFIFMMLIGLARAGNQLNTDTLEHLLKNGIKMTE